MIRAYCDGGCRGNQFKENIGAWAFYIPTPNPYDDVFEIYNHTYNTTNNIMEITSCIEALKCLGGMKAMDEEIQIIMDSQYVVSGMNEWVKNWIKNGWRTSTKKPVENQEYWKELLELSKHFSNLKFVKCKGHADDEGNNRADLLVNIAMDNA